MNSVGRFLFIVVLGMLWMLIAHSIGHSSGYAEGRQQGPKASAEDLAKAIEQGFITGASVTQAMCNIRVKNATTNKPEGVR